MALHFNGQLAFHYRQLFTTPPPAPSTVDLKGKVGIVTGSNTGLGFYASKQLLQLGLSHLILAVRDEEKGQTAKTTLSTCVSEPQNGPTIDVWPLDLDSYKSIDAFVTKLKTSGIKPDFIILNAGVGKFEFEASKNTGNEVTVQTNWLSTALLALLLLPVLDTAAAGKSSPPVLSFVGSEGGAWAKFKERTEAEKQNVPVLSVLNQKSSFDAQDRYFASKFLQSAFVHSLARKRAEAGPSVRDRVIINIVNPGFCYGTDLHRDGKGLIGGVIGIYKRAIGHSVDVGARILRIELQRSYGEWVHPTVHAATWAGKESNGLFLSDCTVAIYPDLLEREEGRAVEEKLWEELVAELQKGHDMTKVLSDAQV